MEASWETLINPAWKISSTEQIRCGSEILIDEFKFTNEKSYRLYLRESFEPKKPMMGSLHGGGGYGGDRNQYI